MPPSAPIVGAIRGRGAKSNHTGRYEPEAREDFDDGWTADEPPPDRIDTVLTAERAKTIITRNDSPDISFDRSINPYRGCEHGCVYCYARPAHAYVGLSPGIDFETKIFFKADAARLLERELSKKGYQPRIIHIGGNTDPYQPPERKLKVTRSILEVLQRFNHPFSIITKSALIARDADIIGEMGRRDLARPYVSITTLDRQLARVMEPRASTPERRLQAVKALADAGAQVGVGFAPVIPGLNDHELEAVLKRAVEAGATSAMFTMLRLPREIKDLFREWLDAEVPDRAKKVMSLVRQMRGGLDYDVRWGSRMTGEGPIAELVAARFRRACASLGLNASHQRLRLDLFKVPAGEGGQMDLFGG